jgi:hypothetical protein
MTVVDHACAVALPGGCWVEGTRHREARLRPFTGADEAFLQENAGALSMAQWTTRLLARCLVALGPFEPVPIAAVQGLNVGDREALLLQLRRLTLGDRISCVVKCPACGEQMDLELGAGALLVESYPESTPVYETTFQKNGDAWQVRFRVPTGEDQERAAGLAARDPRAAAELILQRCVEHLGKDNENNLPRDAWPDQAFEQLSKLMAELDPQAEILLHLDCPYCDHAFSTMFDTASFFQAELGRQTADLYREVHWLVCYHHWSESEIMEMPTPKCRRDIRLWTETVNESQRAQSL